MKFYSLLFFYIITVMPAYSQLSSSTYGNCTENTYGFVHMGNKSQNIPPVYCDASPFSEGLAAVKKGNKWGFIDANNRPIIAFQFDGARSFRDGLSIVRQDDLYGVINKQGAWVIPPRYYDLMPYELEGKLYFISRDSTFFQGMIDRAGHTILPHRYTYLMTLESNIHTGQRFYNNIPFYTVFREIDTRTQSFYEQFTADAFEFAPEKGLHTLYDLQFNPLVSRPSTHHSDGFQHEELLQINAYLAKHSDSTPEQKVKAIDSLLAHAHPEPMPQPPTSMMGRMSDEQVAHYLDSLGYHFFTQNGKTGLKQGDQILIPAKHTALKPVTAIIPSPRSEDLPILQRHYGGRYRDKEKGIFELVVLVPHEGDFVQASTQYSLSGAIELPVRKTDKHNRTILTKVNPLGFEYLHTTADTAGRPIQSHGMVDWAGKELLPPVYRSIKVVHSDHLLVTQENTVQNGVEEYVGVLDASGQTLIPLGTYSDIQPFTQPGAEDLYLATWSDPYPTVAEKKEARYTNQTHVILKVGEEGSQVINSFIATAPVYPSSLDTETGMLQYRVNHAAHAPHKEQ